jgi:hypothetical protein
MATWMKWPASFPAFIEIHQILRPQRITWKHSRPVYEKSTLAGDKASVPPGTDAIQGVLIMSIPIRKRKGAC